MVIRNQLRITNVILCPMHDTAKEMLETLQIIPPDKLMGLADWIDKMDSETGGTGTEVQEDVRRLAFKSYYAIQAATRKGR